MSEFQLRVVAWISAKQLIIEITLVLLVGFALILKYLNLEGADEAIMITMLTLAGFYFAFSIYIPIGTNNIVLLITSRVFGIASTVCLIGLLFTFLQLPGAKEQLMIGLLSLTMSGASIVFLMATGRMPKAMHMIIRLVVLGVLSLNAYMGLNANTVG
jgi:hypothetical protein